jgi:hypothetical protein
VVELNGSEPPHRSLQFPCATNEEAWRSAVSRGRLRGIQKPQLGVIETYQPKERGEAAESDPFAVLARLSNQDKHRLTIPSVVFRQGMTFGPFQPEGCSVTAVEPLIAEQQPLVAGTDLIRITVTDKTPEGTLGGTR